MSGWVLLGVIGVGVGWSKPMGEAVSVCVCARVSMCGGIHAPLELRAERWLPVELWATSIHHSHQRL